MSITLNIIEHEMKSCGRVIRPLEGNPSFSDVRFFIPGNDVRNQTLYVCDQMEAVAAICEQGAFSVFVGSAAPDPSSSSSDGIALSICGSLSPMAVFDKLLDVFDRHNAWQRDMDRICHTGGSLQDLLDASEPFLRNNVVVLDPALKLIAYTRNTPCDDPITMELIEHGYHTEDNIRKFRLHKRFQPWMESDGFVVNDSHEICKYTTVTKSFKAHSSFSLISVMMCNVESPSRYLYDLFEMFTDAVEFYALRDYPDGKPSGNAVDSFLNDLANNFSPDEETVIERCRFVGLPFETTFCLFYIKPAKDSVPRSRLLADVSLAVAPAKTISIDDAVVVLCFNCSANRCNAQHACRHCAKGGTTITQRLNAMMRRFDLTCGRSSSFSKLSGFATAFAQARAAYEFGLNSKRDEDAACRAALEDSAADANRDRVFSFDACCMDYLVRQLTTEQVSLITSSYAGLIIGTIAEHDAQAGTDNYEFLHSYLMLERRTSTVADALHMHRNNVNYRIGRIEELYDIDLDDAALRVDLLVAYRIREALLRQH